MPHTITPFLYWSLPRIQSHAISLRLPLLILSPTIRFFSPVPFALYVLSSFPFLYLANIPSLCHLGNELCLSSNAFYYVAVPSLCHLSVISPHSQTTRLSFMSPLPQGYIAPLPSQQVCLANDSLTNARDSGLYHETSFCTLRHCFSQLNPLNTHTCTQAKARYFPPLLACT